MSTGRDNPADLSNDLDWATLERAARILAPSAGGTIHASEKVLQGLSEGRLRPLLTRPSPKHPSARHSRSKTVDLRWFRTWRNRLETDENAREWQDWFFHGGLILPRVDVEAIKDRQPVGGRLKAHWPLPVAVAWIATRNEEAVGRMLSDDAWELPVAEPPVSLDEVLANRANARATGRLAEEIAGSFCSCGASLQAQFEQWETCACIDIAIDNLQDALCVDERIVAFDKLTLEPIPGAKLPLLTYASGSFNIRFHASIARVLLRAQDVRRVWSGNVATCTPPVLGIGASKTPENVAPALAPSVIGDAEAIAMMRHMILQARDRGEIIRIRRAARAVASRVTGNSTTAKEDRLRKRYSKDYAAAESGDDRAQKDPT